MLRIANKLLISVLSVLTLLVMLSTPTMASCYNDYTQRYDYDTGIDSWLSNSTIWYPALDNGYHLFSNSPVPTQISNPQHGLREHADQSIGAADNFYTYYQDWIWDLPGIYANNYSYRMLYYLTDNGGNYYYDGSGIANAYDALFVNFYKRPTPRYEGDEAPRLADLSRQIYQVGNTYWVKPNDPIVFQNYGYNSSDGNWLRHSYLHVVDNSNGNVLGSFDAANGYPSSSNGSSWLSAQLAYATSSNGMNTGIYQFALPYDGETVALKSAFMNGIGVGNHDGNYTGTSGDMNWEDSGYTVKSDGIAPGFTDATNTVVDSRVSTIVNLDENLNANIRIDNLFDNGSGIRDVYCKMYPTGREAEAKKFQLVNNNGEWVLSNMDTYALFQSSDINIDIYTEDNVGNVGKIKSQHFNLLTVDSQIVPYDTPTFTGVPTLEKGQKAILKIYTTGYADKLQITFPPQLTAVDSSLNKTMNIVPQAHAETDVVFNVPRYINDNTYTVNVKATNSVNNTTVESDPQFIVSNDILDGYRTGILNDNP